MLYLRLPVAISSSGERLDGELYLTSRMRGLRICIVRDANAPARQRFCETSGDEGYATLLVSAPEKVLARHVLAAVDWVRSKRLLRSLPIEIAAASQDVPVALKSAARRPVSVAKVYTPLAYAV